MVVRDKPAIYTATQAHLANEKYLHGLALFGWNGST
jgi:hypothetical protein